MKTNEKIKVSVKENVEKVRKVQKVEIVQKVENVQKVEKVRKVQKVEIVQNEQYATGAINALDTRTKHTINTKHTIDTKHTIAAKHTKHTIDTKHTYNMFGSRVILALLLAFVFVISSFAGLPEQTAEAATAKLNYSKKTLYVGETLKLRVKNSKDTFLFSSSNAKVSKVVADGTVTALKKGSALITAKSSTGKNSYNCRITVKKPYVTPKDVKALIPGQTLQMGVKGAAPVKFTSSDSSIARVDSKTGLVTAVKGSDYYVTIKVKCSNGKTYKRNVCVIDLGFDFNTDPDNGTNENGTDTGKNGDNPGKDKDGNAQKFLEVPSIPADSYGLFNPQKKTTRKLQKLYEITNRDQLAKALKEAYDSCNEEVSVYSPSMNAYDIHELFLELCGKYSILADYAGYIQQSFDTNTWFTYTYGDSPDYDELLYNALQNGENIFTQNVETIRPIYSVAAKASALLRYSDYQADEETKRLLKQAEDIVKEAIVNAKDLRGAIENINNKICELATYDNNVDLKSESAYLGSDGKYHRVKSLDATGILDNGKGVCEAYTSLFALCMDILGVTNDKVCNSGNTHIWNRVKLDGTWYHVDVTWNDELGNAYLLVKASELPELDKKYSPKNLNEHSFLTDYLK